jgi:hypothetical protein
VCQKPRALRGRPRASILHQWWGNRSCFGQLLTVFMRCLGHKRPVGGCFKSTTASTAAAAATATAAAAAAAAAAPPRRCRRCHRHRRRKIQKKSAPPANVLRAAIAVYIDTCHLTACMRAHTSQFTHAVELRADEDLMVAELAQIRQAMRQTLQRTGSLAQVWPRSNNQLGRSGDETRKCQRAVETRDSKI